MVDAKKYQIPDIQLASIIIKILDEEQKPVNALGFSILIDGNGMSIMTDKDGIIEVPKPKNEIQISLAGGESGAVKEEIKNAEISKETKESTNIYVIKKSGVIVTPQIQKVLDELENYFGKEDLKVYVTSGVRTAQDQLRIITNKAKKYGLDKKYPSILNATVENVDSWRDAWDELLNIKGFIVNPPKVTKCKLGKRAGKTVYLSPHQQKKAFDLSGAPLDSIKAVVEKYQKDGGSITQILLERVNGCVHIGISITK